MDREKLRAWRALLEVHSGLLRKLETELQEEVGLPLTWYDVLYQLSEMPDGGLRMQDLAARLLISRSGFTRLSDRMVAAGLVERRPCTTDRRGIFVVLTEAGRQTLARAAPVHLRGIREHFADRLDQESTTDLLRALDLLSADLVHKD